MTSLHDKLAEIQKRADTSTDGPWTKMIFNKYSKDDITLLLAMLQRAVGPLRYYSSVYPEWDAAIYTQRAKDAIKDLEQLANGKEE